MRAQQYLRWILQILLLNILFVFVGFLWRLAFFLSYGQSSLSTQFNSELLKAFLLGARFDWTVLCYINALPLLFFFIVSCLAKFSVQAPNSQRSLLSAHPTFQQQTGQILAIFYTALLFIVNLINVIDLYFYSFYQDRLNLLVFGFLEDDTMALIKTMWKNYPILWIFGSLFLATYFLYRFLAFFFRPKTNSLPEKPISWAVCVLLFFCLNFLNGVAARGSLGLFPLSEMDTNISAEPFLNHLCYNSTRSLARAYELKAAQISHWNSNLEAFGYGENYRQAFADYFRIPLEKVPTDPLQLMHQRTSKNAWAEKNKPHVLLIVMESFGSYWLKFNSPQFDLLGDLKRDFAEDSYMTHFMSSTGATIGSLSSLMIGTHQKSISEFLTESEYLQVPFRSSPARVFKAAGYGTRFIYGGNPGWREVDKFARFQSFDKVEGETEIEKNLGGLKEKHDWGVYDEDVWEHLWKSLQNAKDPQFVLTMTTTNHPPYQLPKSYIAPKLEIPKELQSRLIGEPSLPPKRFATYRYSTQKLAEFIRRIKTSPLKDKVIIAVTGDHTFWLVNFKEDELLQKSAVPFYLYVPPAITKKLNPKNFGSHPDILPTLYNLALSNASYDSTAQDLLAKRRAQDFQTYALDHSNIVLGPAGAVQLSGKNLNHYYGWENNYQRLIPSIENSELAAMALHYRSLMGVLDYYMMYEKSSSKSESPQDAYSRR